MPCLKVINIKVRSLSVEYNEVSWELEPTSEDALDYTFEVLRSEGPEGPFAPVAPPFDDQYIFVDNIIKSANRHRQYFYKVRITSKMSGDSEEFGPASLGADAELVTIELRTHMNLLFKEYAGRLCWLLPVRTFGQRCTCFNETLQRRTRSGCRTCYDTGFVRGYMHPIEFWAQFDPSPKAEQETSLGKLEQSNTTLRFGYWPPAKPGDLIIESENRRWRVVQVSSTQHNRSVVHQEVQVHEVPKSDIEYLIELQLDKALRDITSSPPRNFTNPHNLEAFEDEHIPAIYDLYSGCSR